MANYGTERVYQEFEPATRWTSEADAEILVVDLPGFKKEQLKVAVTTTKKVRITGERSGSGNKWIRFHKEIPAPLNVDVDSVSAMFKDNKLYIRHPKVKSETPQTKPPSPVIIKPREQHETKTKQDEVEKQNVRETHQPKQQRGKEVIGERKGPSSSKDEEEKEKVGAKWFEKYREATGNAVKEVKNKRKLICNLAASVSLVLLFIVYARNALLRSSSSSSLVWKSDE